MEPIISIITPTFNLVENAKADDFNLLVKLLDLQTYTNLEHIIIDNASTDGTVELLKDYKNKGYLNFYSEKDTGKFNALNRGIMRSKGKYLVFLSCDDFLHDITALADVVSLLEANQADFSYSTAYCRHPEGFTFLFAPSMHNTFQVLPCARQGMVFKKSVIEKLNYFDEKFKIMADYDLIIRLMLKKIRGVYFDRNYTTYKLGQKSFEQPERCIEESKVLFNKNYRAFHPMDEEILERMARLSLFPQPLLAKFAEFFPPQDREIFFERCDQMHQIRAEALKKPHQKL